jgi:hypothetical protein
MSKVELNDDDVISMEANWSLLGTSTFKVSQIIQCLKDRVGASIIGRWFVEGAECEVLSPRGGGWQKGKIRIHFEFIPDEPTSVEDSEQTFMLGGETESSDRTGNEPQS